MSLLKKLLVIVTAVGVLGPIRAEIVDQVPDRDTPAAKDSDSYFASAVSDPYSFADIINLPAGAERRLLTGDPVSRARGGTLAELSNIANATAARRAGANGAGTLLGAVSTLNGVIDDLSVFVVKDNFSASRSGSEGWHTGAGFLFSTAEIPEPADWMTLLCGLLVVAFMARRKSGPFAD